MKKYIYLFVLASFSTGLANAQSIAGVVRDVEEKPVNAATVALLKAADSSVVKFTASGANGEYKFSSLAEGKYLVRITHTSYLPAYSEALAVSNTDLTVLPLVMNRKEGQLQGVTVTANRPIIEVKADKTILNVEGTINSTGSDGLELLRKSPGIMVDKDDNIIMSGKNGVRVYIDGRPSPLAGKELSDYLKTIQSSSIDALELITNPSARYDAAGNAGIINIRLKKDKNLGANGSVNAGYAIGINPRYNGGLTFNNRSRKSNVYGNINAFKNKSRNVFNMYRSVADSIFEQNSPSLSRVNGLNYKAGVDFFLSTNHTVGIMLNGSTFNNDQSTTGRTTIAGKNGTVSRYLHSDNRSDMSRDNINFNGNYRFADAKKGQELNVDLDYGRFNNNTDQYQPNEYFDPITMVKLSSRNYRMLAPSQITMASAKGDYDKTIGKGKLSLGIKTSNVSSTNRFSRYDVAGTSQFLDTARSNNFDYNELINAGYVTYAMPVKKIQLQAGLRIENTHSKGESNGYAMGNTKYEPYDSSFSRSYTDFFPNLSLSYTHKMNQTSLSFSRRIDRPAYRDLNPFEMKMDEYTYMRGNIYLRPQYTNTVALTNVYKYKLTTSLTYSHVKDMFAQLVDTTEKFKSMMTNKNLASQDIISFNVSYPLVIKKYTGFFNLNSFYSLYKANFGTGRDIDLEVFAATIFSQQSYKINKIFTAELSGWYVTPSVYQGTFKSEGMGGIEVGASANLFKGKATLKTSVSDVLKTMQWAGTSDFAGQHSRAWGNWESRQFKLNLVYRFGNAQVKAARQRKTALDDESKRSQGGGTGIGVQQ